MEKIDFIATAEQHQGAGEIYLIHPAFDDKGEEETFENFYITDRGTDLLKSGKTYRVTIEEINEIKKIKRIKHERIAATCGN